MPASTFFWDFGMRFCRFELLAQRFQWNFKNFANAGLRPEIVQNDRAVGVGA